MRGARTPCARASYPAHLTERELDAKASSAVNCNTIYVGDALFTCCTIAETTYAGMKVLSSSVWMYSALSCAVCTATTERYYRV